MDGCSRGKIVLRLCGYYKADAGKLNHIMTIEHLASLQDSELIEACLRGSDQAWEVLLVRYQRLIYSIPLRYGFLEHDANDIFQNVSILLLENMDRLRDRERLGAWLVVTTRRECWRVLRQQRDVPLSPDVAAMGQGVSKSQTEDSFLAIERQSMVHSAIELMGNPCRRLLTMLFYDDPRPGYAAVARELSIPQGSIGPTRARCLEKLMNTLEQMGFSET